MLSWSSERRLLQGVVAVGACVPVAAGLAGAWRGAAMFGARLPVDGELASHIHYLSGLLLGIGLAFWASLPRIEQQGPRFRLLATIVLIGGIARLCAAIATGSWSKGTAAALTMELAVTPALALWQRSLAARSSQSSLAAGS